MVLSYKDGMSEDEIKNIVLKETDFLIEPKSANGTVVAMNVKGVEILPRRRGQRRVSCCGM